MKTKIEEDKKYIDGLSYEQLLTRWRFAPVGDRFFQGDLGKYWACRMKELKNQPGGHALHTSASKSIGWEYNHKSKKQ